MKKTPEWALDVLPAYFGHIAGGMSHEDAALAVKDAYPEETAGKSLGTILRNMRNARQNFVQYGGEEATFEGELARQSFHGLVPPPLAPTAFEPLVLPYEDCLVWCDIHIPYHRADVIEQSLESAVNHGLKNLLIAGDLMDIHWGSKFMSWKTKGGHHENIRQEFAITQKIFSILDRTFEKIIIIPGNHDGGRFMHMTGGSVDFELLCSWMFGYRVDEKPEKLKIGLNRSVTLQGSPRGDWRITHPRKARKVPLALAEELAAKFQCNVLTAHQHHLGVRMHRHLPYICCDGGHMQDERITDYKQEVDDAHANWVAGWVELVDGWPNCYAATRVDHRRSTWEDTGEDD